MTAAELAARPLSRSEIRARLDRMPPDTSGGDERLIAALVMDARLNPPPVFDLPPETPGRKRARLLVERALVAMRFSAPANDVLACLVRAADMYEQADEVEP